MKYDLVIRGGEVVDPGSGLRGRMDVAIAGGKIAQVAPSLREADARKTISAKDRLVIPGARRCACAYLRQLLGYGRAHRSLVQFERRHHRVRRRQRRLGEFRRP
jgi:hypothetical protein